MLTLALASILALSHPHHDTVLQVSFEKSMVSIGKNLTEFGRDARDAVGLGPEAKNFNTCTDSAFFIVHDEVPVTGKKSVTLKGTLSTPQPGFHYAFQITSVDVAQASAILSLGQPLRGDGSFGRGMPAVTQLQIEQKIKLPETVGLLHIQVNGLTPMPTSFTCDLTLMPPKEEQPEQ